MKPIASLSLDLDNQWAYMKTHGDAGWESFPSYLDLAVPRILTFLKERNLRITFFIVGQDAALEKNHAAIRSIHDAGHEIANHSFNHEPWLHLYSRDEIVEEFEKTENAIESVTGTRPVGFRGPGFSLSPTVIEVLGERGYEYDCSTLPTYIAPIARAFYFLKSPKMGAEEKEKLKTLFGKFSDGFQTLKPHFVETAGKTDEFAEDLGPAFLGEGQFFQPKHSRTFAEYGAIPGRVKRFDGSRRVGRLFVNQIVEQAVASNRDGVDLGVAPADEEEVGGVAGEMPKCFTECQ